MTDVFSIGEAENFFLSNSRDSCTGYKMHESKVFECYPDAVAFFTEPPKERIMSEIKQTIESEPVTNLNGSTDDTLADRANRC